MFEPRQLLMAAITLATVCVAAVAAGCGGGSSGSGPTTPTAKTAPAQPPALGDPGPQAAGTQLYDGQAFAIAYPGGWWVHDGERPRSFGTVTTILDPADHARSVRIEVRQRAAGPRPATARRVSFEGHDALRWQANVDRHGRALHRETLVFTDDAGRGITIVTQAPADQYARWARSFAATRSSFLPY